MVVVKILFLVFFQLSLVSLLLVPKLRSEPTYLTNFCPITTVFAPTSKYEADLNTLFHSLSSNATNSGFFSSAVDNAVYGLFLCRADLNATACSNCVTTATTTDLPSKYCRNRKQAVIWYDECMVRYSNHPLSGKMEKYPQTLMMNTQNTTGSQTGFPELLQRTLNDAVLHATSDGSRKKFATSEVNIKGGSHKTLYAMAQCTPDLNTSACAKCLEVAVMIIPLSDGGRVLQPSCNIRYETYRFFILSTPLASAPTPSAGVSGATNNLVPTSPTGTSATEKRTVSSYWNVFGGVGIFVVLNLYYYTF